ncbi:hypothetical protein BVG88_18240 [Serratia marcescens]|uniref:fimbrial protein n=1 Tax=Serratia marcescens TaxID=615 RepID=UPI000B5F590A|nr:fimbrial protein [Serratia marcescens]ASM03983.1 hypothetical protein BVG88_18240 [Serratia marcescens]
MGGCNGSSCQFQDQVYARVYLNYNITVPQNCVINAGEVISVDFGSLPSTAFYSPGVKAKNVNPITRVVSMQCNNIETQTPVRLRVEANLASGNAIVSDNRDVGFVIGSNDGKELTPNLFSSYIPFRTSNEGGTSSVPIVIWPVSVTGRTPNEGPVTALGFLRVDFD